jgi:hypothetical protein
MYQCAAFRLNVKTLRLYLLLLLLLLLLHGSSLGPNGPVCRKRGTVSSSTISCWLGMPQAPTVALSMTYDAAAAAALVVVVVVLL